MMTFKQSSGPLTGNDTLLSYSHTSCQPIKAHTQVWLEHSAGTELDVKSWADGFISWFKL